MSPRIPSTTRTRKAVRVCGWGSGRPLFPTASKRLSSHCRSTGLSGQFGHRLRKHAGRYGAAAPMYSLDIGPESLWNLKRHVEHSRASRPAGAGTPIFRGRTAEELTASEQEDFLEHRRRLRADPAYRKVWASLVAAASPILPILPGVTPYSQQLSANRALMPQLTAYHNAAVETLIDAGAADPVEPPFVPQGGLNLFKWNHPTSTREVGWNVGDRFLYLPNQGSPKANWLQNAGRLRLEMSKGYPIVDSFRDSATGEQIPSRGFLNAERKLLESRGWRYDSRTGAYYPPSGK